MERLSGLSLTSVAPALLLASFAFAGCEPLRGAVGDPADVRHVAALEGFQEPESAQHDPAQDVWFVSNIVGYGSVKDNDGYIARIDARLLERGEILAQGGVGGVELHAPKGMALQGDTLWVADIDVLRGFHRVTGEVVATVDMAPYGAMLLNAITIGPDGEVVITDSAIRMTDKGVVFEKGSRIFAVRGGPAGRSVAVIAEGDWLIHPNGIAWDPDGRRYVVAAFNPFISEVYAIRPGDTARTTLHRTTGRLDGLLRMPDGRFLFTSWPDSALHVLEGGEARRLASHIWTPADLGWDSLRSRVGIPSVLQGRVHLYEIPQGREPARRQRARPPGT
jgi:hypothetical protein